VTGNSDRRRTVGLALLGIGVVSGLCSAGLLYGPSEAADYPGESGLVLLWVLSIAAVVGVIGGLVFIVRPRKARSAATLEGVTTGKGSGRRARRALIIGGVVAMCVSPFTGSLIFLVAPVGALMVLIGSARRGRRALGVALLCIGVVSALSFYPTAFGLHDEGADPGVIGWVILGGIAATAAVGIIVGLGLIVWPRRGGRNSQGLDLEIPRP
jgi:hypothetical protein